MPFFGAEAPFPLGPFAVLARYELPALAVFALKTSVRGYRLLVRRLPTPPAGLRRLQRAEWLARAFAEELERVVRSYPDQWFNFFDFWAAAPRPADTTPPSA